MSYHNLDEIRERIAEIRDEMDEISEADNPTDKDYYEQLRDELDSLENAEAVLDSGQDLIPESEIKDYEIEINGATHYYR